MEIVEVDFQIGDLTKEVIGGGGGFFAGIILELVLT